MESPTAKISFCLHDPSNEVGTENGIALAGNHPALGMWQADKSVPLLEDSHDQTRYKTAVAVDIPMGTEVHYKYMITNNNGQFVQWEPLEGSRVLTVSDYNVTVFDAFGRKESSYQSMEGETGACFSSSYAVPSETTEASFAPAGAETVNSDGRYGENLGQNREQQSNRSGLRSTLAATDRTAPGSSTARSVSWGSTHQQTRDNNPRLNSLESSFPKRFDEVGIEDGDGVVIAQYHLPVLLSRRADGSWHVSWDDEHLLSRKRHTIPQQTNVRIQWVGVPNVYVPEKEQEAVISALAPFRCIPVFLGEKLSQEFYEGFCKDTLWPVFHNVVDVYGEYPTRWWNRTKQGGRWKAYTDVNRIFAEKVVEAYNEGDLVWIHDYHLLLLPSFLVRRHLRSANIGLFIHSPFPSSEIFRTLSMRDDLLRGMICADHIGFHLYEYARHFVTCCRRILGLDYTHKPGGRIALHYQGRDVVITVSHVGIEPDILANRLKQEVALDQCKYFKEMIAKSRIQYSNLSQEPKIIAGVESLERLKGIPLKLLAFELFLEEYPRWTPSVCLIQVGLIDLSRKADCEATLREAVQLADRINRRFDGTQSEFGDSCGIPPKIDGPIVYLLKRQGTLSLDDRLGLWSCADIFLSTPIRDSLNLWALEYAFVTSKDSAIVNCVPRSETGKVIVSEFSGCSRVLNGALRVNPWQHDHVLSAIASSLEMSEDEASDRANSNMSFINSCTTSTWAIRVLMDLKRASKQATARTYMGYGFGFHYRQTAFPCDFQQLDNEDVIRAYKRTKKRLFVFDYGGVLNLVDDTQEDGTSMKRKALEMGVPTESLLEESPVPQEVLQALRDLASDPRNTVLIVSGKERYVLDRIFPDCPELCLAAEQGFYYKFGTGCNFPTTSPSRSGWYQIGEHFDYSWQGLAYTIMESYTARTNGTYISTKGSAMVWHFADADSEFGLMQAKELQDHLNSVLKNFPIEVVMGIMYVEVRPKGVNKGVIVQHFVDLLEGRSSKIVFSQGTNNSTVYNRTQQDESPMNKNEEAGGESDSESRPAKVKNKDAVACVDLLFAIGDDTADELMFSKLRERWDMIKRHQHRGTRSNFLENTSNSKLPINRSASGSALSSRDRTGFHQKQKTEKHDIPHPGRSQSSNWKHHHTDLSRKPRQGLLESSSSITSLRSASSGSHQSLASLNNEGVEHFAREDVYQFSVVVGKSPSAAQYFVEDPSDVAELLRALQKEVERSRMKESRDIQQQRSSPTSKPITLQTSITMPDFRSMHESRPQVQNDTFFLPEEEEEEHDTEISQPMTRSSGSMITLPLKGTHVSSTDLSTYLEECPQGPLWF
eukprot:gb/GECG01015281.1/.p1 GENE.gb/GECG01015281.1/~~gb/GECG01015281.1/.p1  ORF type:complete len:1335 (+),score=160.38 gb/GECG01015281.1/:1-4005(+)